MFDFLLYIFIPFAAISGNFATVRQFQMLQQNSYFFIRYFKWYKGNFGATNIVRIIFAVLGVLFFSLKERFINDTAAIIILCALLFLPIILAFVSVLKNKKSIKKLVVTARVKRMIGTAICIFAVISAICYFLPTFTALLYALAVLPAVIVTASLFIMKPIEKAISNHYINDAKKILKSMPNLKIIGVTGSYGKTSTKCILGRILSEKYNTLITPENYNTPMGIVITVKKFLRPETEIFVCEMGAKRKGDIREDCEIANPDLGIITSVGPQHLDTFGNIQTVADTKFELADCVKKNGGKMYINTDNPIIKEKSGLYDCITYGVGDCEVKAENISYSPLGLTLDIVKGNTRFTVTSKLLGNHNALNITAAAAVALDLNVSPAEITFAVSKLKPIEHRLEMKPYISGSVLIDDAYNSNPEGCLEAVRVLGCFEGMKKIIVTPGLVELGEKEYECNRRLGEEAAKHCDIIILVGKNRSKPIADGVKSTDFDTDNLYIVSSFFEAKELFSKMCDQNTAILFENDLPDNYLN
jgi:UDP-N-acetylmuramoyl-tripeptide--D-alanyl-D-alanine ligase